MQTNLCRTDDIAAFLADELSSAEKVEFEMHLAGCNSCRDALDSARSVVSLLRTVPRVEVGSDLAPQILSRLHDADVITPGFGSTPYWKRTAAIAAALALFVGGASIYQLKRRTPTAPPEAALPTEIAMSAENAFDWFCRNQEMDGSWDAEKWGGSRRFQVALTALPMLALSSAEPLTPERSAAVSKAALWLQTQQTKDGAFGPQFQGLPYNQSIATFALLQAYKRQPSDTLKRSIDAALGQLLAKQTADGGWGYLRSPLADRSITEWHVEALELASALGWENAQPNLKRASDWLAANPHPRSEAEEPPDSPSALLARTSDAADGVAMDFYGSYFLATTSSTSPDGPYSQRLATIRDTILQRQAADGAHSGSWAADDRWGRAGGRLYSTALASLFLVSISR